MKRKKLSRSKWIKKCKPLWSWCVRAAADFRCELCGKGGTVHAHHKIAVASNTSFYRFWPENGICLCFSHHVGDGTCSAHLAPWNYIELLKERAFVHYDWWDEHRFNIPSGKDIDYEAIYQELLDWKKDLQEGRYVRRFLGMKEQRP